MLRCTLQGTAGHSHLEDVNYTLDTLKSEVPDTKSQCMMDPSPSYRACPKWSWLSLT